MAVFLVNSRLDLLSAAHYLLQCEPHFSRSYVCILPSSLTRGRSCALDFSSFLPVSVSGTVPYSLALDSISRHLDSSRFDSTFSPLPFKSAQSTVLPIPLNTSLIRPILPFIGRDSPHASCLRNCRKCRTLYRLPIDCAFLPRLRDRLTQRRLPLHWKP